MRSYPDSAAARAALVPQGNATHLLPVEGKKPIVLVANAAILAGFDDKVFEQAVNTAEGPGVEQVIINPDAHAGYGCPVGSVVITDGYVYPGPVGPDICCSMSFLQTNLPADALEDKAVRRKMINAIGERIPTGMGSRQAPKAPKVDQATLEWATVMGADPAVLDVLGIPAHWADRCEAASAPNGLIGCLDDRLSQHDDRIRAKLVQACSTGGGNHFISCDVAEVARAPMAADIASSFGVTNGRVGFLTHCGSRGFGFQLAARHFRGLADHFARWGIPLPGGDKELVYAPVDSPEGQAYLLDMHLGANFATINHLLINWALCDAVNEVFGPQTDAELVYHISHNIGREEIVGGHKRWVFRKGATRAFPSGHPTLKGTHYADTGHPVLLPGNARDGSLIMVGDAAGGAKTAYSVNHGAGRAMGRKHAKRTLNQAAVDADLLASDILYNGRSYPIDEAPDAYKDFAQVTASVEEALLATTVAKLTPRFVIKDMDQSAEGAA